MLDIKYYSKLKQQYASALGIDPNNAVTEEVLSWNYDNEINAEFYKSALLSNLIFYFDSNYAEIGKGAFDTILSEDDKAIISSNFSYTFNAADFKGRVFTNNIQFSSVPYVLIEHKETRSFKIYKFDEGTKFFTQNVYSYADLEQMRSLSDFDNEIIVGAFGNINDKDRITKIKILRDFKNSLLSGNSKEYYYYQNDSYSYFIQNIPVTHKKKTLHNK